MNGRFWAKDWQAAADVVKRKCPQEVQCSLLVAQDVLKNCFVFRDKWEMERTNIPVQFTDKICWEHVENDDPEWTYAMNRHTSFVNLGKAWRYTGDIKYAKKFVELVQDWINGVPLNEESAHTTWRSLEAGLRCETWLRAMFLLEDSGMLTQPLKQKMEDSLKMHGDYLVKSSYAFQKLSNWGVLQDHGLLLLGIYFNNQEWIALALNRLDQELHRQVMRDGSHWEQSPMYHCEVLHCAMDALMVAWQNGISVPKRLEENIHRMCHALTAWITPWGHLVCQSDSDDIDARDLLIQGAILFHDAELWICGGKTLYEMNYWDFGIQAEQMAKSFALNPMKENPIEQSKALPDSGNYMLKGTEQGYLHFHCGSMGGGHGHADQLHIDAGIAQEDILVDSGRYTYVNNQTRLYLKSPAAHNTTRVDHMNFSECKDTWEYDVLATSVKGQHCFTQHADYVSGMHLGYMQRGVAVRRRVVWLKKMNAAIILDDFYASQESLHIYEQNFHFASGELTQNGVRFDWKGKNAGASLWCLSPAEICLSEAIYSKEYNRLQTGKTICVKNNCCGWNSFVTVLVMNANGLPQANAEMIAVKATATGQIVSRHAAEAVKLQVGEEQATVVLCNQDKTIMLSAGQFEGYGQVMVYDHYNPEGICLAW